jgi:hypothetical protein
MPGGGKNVAFPEWVGAAEGVAYISYSLKRESHYAALRFYAPELEAHRNGSHASLN